MRKPSVNLSEDWMGKRFGKLVVTGFGYNKKTQNNTWKCRCDCGNSVEVYPGNAKAGRVRSCGCAQIESATTHGQRYTRLYRTWVDMRRRCRDVNHPTYENYGARGIAVCDEWQNYTIFHEWAMSNGYSDNLTIDRIDVDGNYEPRNCRWATAKLQGNNRRTTRYISVCGEDLAVTEAIEKYGMSISENTLLKRLDKHGFSDEQALFFPLRASAVRC